MRNVGLKDALEKATEIAEALEAAHICVAFVKLVKQLAKPAVLWSMGKGFALFGFSQTLRSGHDLFLSAEFFSDRA